MSRARDFARLAWPPLASAALLWLAFPPANLFLLVFVALVPWLLFLRTATPRQALLSGAIFGLTFMLAQMAFLVPFVGRWTGSWALATIPWVLSALIVTPWFILVGWLLNRVMARGWLWAIPLVWAAVEVARSTVPHLAFPWGLVAMPLWLAPAVIQTAAFGTIFFVGAWVMLANVLALGVMTGSSPLVTGRIMILFLTLGAASVARYAQPPGGEKTVLVAGQLGVDMAFTPEREQPALIREASIDLAAVAALANARLLVLPEGIADWPLGRPIPETPLGARPPVPLIMGGRREGDRGVYQSAFGWDGEWRAADKSRLVLFGEYVPFRDRLPFLASFNLPGSDLLPAERPSTLTVNGLKAGPVICFEALFPDIAIHQTDAGARLLTVISIDDWYMASAVPQILYGASAWRAVENGLPVLRSASLGYSGAFDARGNQIARLPLGERRALRVELDVPPSGDAWPYRKWVPWGLLVVGLGVAFWPRSRREASAERQA